MTELLVEDPEQIRLLGSTVRQDIVDHLDFAGPSTVPELAAALGCPTDTLYYHLNLLLEAGLLVRHDREDDRRMVVDLPASSVEVRYHRDDRPAVEAIVSAVATLLRSAERRFAGALDDDELPLELEGPRRNHWASRVRGRLTEAEVVEVNEAIRAIHGIFRRSRSRPDPLEGRMHEVTVVLSPLPEGPTDRRRVEG